MLIAFLVTQLFASSIVIPSTSTALELEGNKSRGFLGPFQGVNFLGYNTTIPESKENHKSIPDRYIDQSFRLISDAGLNIVRYLFSWESYEKDPRLFIEEILKVSQYADKHNLSVIYTNSQFHISSWLDSLSGYGFPSKLFRANKDLPYNGGGASDNATARLWWSKWYDRLITDERGNDGWSLQAAFLGRIVTAVDNHTSTLGYEILNEPEVYSVDQWKKIGNYNTFVASALRKVTEKIIIFDRQLPSDVGGPIHALPANMADMMPRNISNLVFKATLFGLPTQCSHAEARLNTAAKTAQIMGIPLWLGEFNIGITPQDRAADINQSEVNLFINKFREVNAWGWSFWIWSFREPSKAEKNYGLVNVTEREIRPTKYFEYLKNALASSGTQENTEADMNYSMATNDVILNTGHDRTLQSTDDTICPTAPVTKIIGTAAGTNYLQSASDDRIKVFVDPHDPKILVEGEAYDAGSGIRAVEIRLADSRYHNVIPHTYGNWSEWNYILPISNSTMPENELIVRVTDAAGNTKHHTIFVDIIKK